MDTLERVIEADLEPLCKAELEGGMRAICTLMVFRTCTALGRKTQLRMDAVAEKRAAQSWLEGGVGLVTFEQACEALDVDAERARKQIKIYAEGMGRQDIKKVATKEPAHVRSLHRFDEPDGSNEHHRQDSDAGSVGTRYRPA